MKFLVKGSKEQKNVLSKVDGLISKFENATEEVKKKGGDVSKYLNWYKTHENGRELWESLASYALNDIEPYSKGNSEIFKFLKAATKFEDLLYGLETYYRDHTLHSLWVYLMGEYILREHVPDIRKNLNWYLYNDIEEESKKYGYPKDLVDFAVDKKEKKLVEKVKIHTDAVWCVMALCHDLGYSLAKLNNLNKRVQDVLKFFDITDLQRIGYSLDIEHQYLVSQFLEIMAMDVRIVPSENYKDEKLPDDERVLVKCYRDDATYWQLCRALEKKQHGILSAYLIYKILSMFGETWVRGAGEEWGLQDDEAIENIIRGDILLAIAQHTFDFAYLDEFSSLSDILMLADELEEFSRLGRDMLSREYHDTTAKASVKFQPENPKPGDDVQINIYYDVEEHLDVDKFHEFFKRKAEQVCRVYSLEERKGKGRRKRIKFAKIESIKLSVEKEGNEIFFHLCRDREKTKALLPPPKLEGLDYIKKKKEHRVKCYEDKIQVILKGSREIALDKWLGIEEKDMEP